MDENKKKGKEKADWNIKPYLAVGLTTFIVIIASILVFFLIFRFEGLNVYLDKLKGILQPITLGMVFAYLLNPIVMFFERHTINYCGKHFKTEKRAKKFSRAIGVTIALLLTIVLFAILLSMVIPELVTSIERLIKVLPKQVDSSMEWVRNYTISDNRIAPYIDQGIERGVKYLENWMQTSLLPQAQSMITSLTSGVISILRALFNVVLGLVVSVYVLMSKETFIGQAKKIIYAVLPAKRGNVIIKTIRKSHQIFGGFISGKILDSVIIGILCFICLYFLKMPYIVLVTVIVGVTNVVPFFGPYIGAIPCTILILLTNPIQGVYFVIFIFILQQFDGNILGPRILGETTGLNSFWVIFAILVAGGLLGFVGMVIGVPLCGVIYYIVKEVTEYVLRKRKLPVATKDYTYAEQVDASTNKLVYLESDHEKNEDN